MVIKELKEPVRQRRKVKAAIFKHSGNLSFAVTPPNLDAEALSNMYSAYHTPSLGASGAIYGLLTAFAFMFPNAELGIMFIPIPIKAKYFVPVIVLLDL